MIKVSNIQVHCQDRIFTFTQYWFIKISGIVLFADRVLLRRHASYSMDDEPYDVLELGPARKKSRHPSFFYSFPLHASVCTYRGPCLKKDHQMSPALITVLLQSRKIIVTGLNLAVSDQAVVSFRKNLISHTCRNFLPILQEKAVP